MRKMMLVFLMLFLPLQWTAALAADCCLRHEAPAQDHAAQLHGEHHPHAHTLGRDIPAHSSLADAELADNADPAPNCNLDCLGCHSHHGAAAVLTLPALSAALSPSNADTPYLSRITTPLPDSLYRPPHAALV